MPRQWHAHKHARWTFEANQIGWTHWSLRYSLKCPAYFNWRIWLILSLLMSFQTIIAFPNPLKFTSTPNDQWRPGQVVAFVEQKIDPGHIWAPSPGNKLQQPLCRRWEGATRLHFLWAVDCWHAESKPSAQCCDCRRLDFYEFDGIWWNSYNFVQVMTSPSTEVQTLDSAAGMCKNSHCSQPELPLDRLDKDIQTYGMPLDSALCPCHKSSLQRRQFRVYGSMSFDSFFTSYKNYVTTFRGCRREGCAICNWFCVA